MHLTKSIATMILLTVLATQCISVVHADGPVCWDTPTPEPTLTPDPTSTPVPTPTETLMPTATALPTNTPWPTLPILTPEPKPSLPPPTNTPPPKPTDPPITPVLGTPIKFETPTPEATPTKPGKYNTPVPTATITWIALPNTGEYDEISSEYDYIIGLMIVLGIAVIGLLAISFALIATRK